MSTRRNIARTICCIVAMIICGGSASYLYSQKYDLRAAIDSVRKDGVITLMFREMPDATNYFIVEGDRAIGTITVRNVQKLRLSTGPLFRVMAEYALENPQDESLIRAGASIGLRKEKERKTRDFSEPRPREMIVYRQKIVSEMDNREMVLVVAGKFIFGSNDGEKDEGPEQMLYLPDYYIDRYEVSNRDYQNFIMRTNGPAPRTWENSVYSEGDADLPVIVTYKEAERYAAWAHKRLPTEEEWEKAARGAGFEIYEMGGHEYMKNRFPRVYPWGMVFDPSRANSREYWESAAKGKGVHAGRTGGLLPVTDFDGPGNAPCGAVNMAGNAIEWTSSWYCAYKGSKYVDRRYGTQVKVLRGGGWFSTGYGVRTTARQIGGLPNLYSDAIGGFRCVKDPTILDRISD